MVHVDVALVERLLPAETATAQALYDARLDLDVALKMLYWLISDHGHHGDPWIFMRMGDGTRQWYRVTDKDDRRYIDRWAGPMANRFGIDVSLAITASLISLVKTGSSATLAQICHRERLQP